MNIIDELFRIDFKIATNKRENDYNLRINQKRVAFLYAGNCAPSVKLINQETKKGRQKPELISNK